MDLEDVVKRMKVIEVEFEDYSSSWKHAYDVTLEPQPSMIFESDAQAINAHTKSQATLSPAEILARMEKEPWLKESVDYWQKRFPVIDAIGKKHGNNYNNS
jgi:hypothetical protein